jgi:predicted RNA-binding protein associated with RNAse of E/G family
VVADTDQTLALYFHAGSTFLHGGLRNRQRLPLEDRLRAYLSDDQPALVETQSRINVLALTPPGERHAVWLFWDDAWHFRTWYVNLQAPLRRTTRSVIVSDHLLDLVVTPDLTWSWKDEDEFEAVCEAGVFTAEERRSIRADGERLAACIEAGLPPFGEDWPAWRPDATWVVPTIPADWLKSETETGAGHND